MLLLTIAKFISQCSQKRSQNFMEKLNIARHKLAIVRQKVRKACLYLNCEKNKSEMQYIG